MLLIYRQERQRAHLALCEDKEHRDGSRDLVHKDHIIPLLLPADAIEYKVCMGIVGQKRAVGQSYCAQHPLHMHAMIWSAGRERNLGKMALYEGFTSEQRRRSTWQPACSARRHRMRACG